MKNLKIKEQYRNSYEVVFIHWVAMRYPNMRSRCHRKFSTKSERAINIHHMREHFKDYGEYGFKIRGRRMGELPDYRDDLRSSIWDLRSWKDRTKRKNQYKPL